MKEPASFVIPEIGKGYGKGFKRLCIMAWILAAVLGSIIAIGLGLARNDWLVVDSNAGATWQERGMWISRAASFTGSTILCFYGLLAAFTKRQWLLMLPSLALAACFPALLYAPQWAVFTFGGGPLALGTVVLKLGDRNENVRKPSAST